MHISTEREPSAKRSSSSWRPTGGWISPWGTEDEIWDDETLQSPAAKKDVQPITQSAGVPAPVLTPAPAAAPVPAVPIMPEAASVPAPAPVLPPVLEASPPNTKPLAPLVHSPLAVIRLKTSSPKPEEPAEHVTTSTRQTERVLTHHAPSSDGTQRHLTLSTGATSKRPVTLPKQQELPFHNKPPQTQRPHKVSSTHPSWPSFVLLFIGMASFVFLALVYLKDVDPAPDEDLRLQQSPDITASTRAPEHLKLFLDSVPPIKNPNLKSKPPWEWDTPSLSQTVQASATALDNLRDILEGFDWHPRHSDWNKADLGSHPAWSDAALLLQVRAAYLARRGEEHAALIATLDLARLSQQLQKILAWPSFTKRALELQSKCCQSTAELLKTTQLDNTQLAVFQDKFKTLAPSLDSVLEAFNGFYIFEKKVLLGPASGEAIDTLPNGIDRPRPGRLFFKTQETLQRFASGYRALKEELTAAPNSDLFNNPSGRVIQTAPQVYQPNATGERYFSDRIDQYLDIPQEFKLAEARRGLVECLFAIRRFMADYKRFPAGLGNLHPTYLSSLPTDPFSADVYVYDPTRGRLSSVGINRVADDQQKITAPSLSDAREPTVELVVQAVPVK